VRPFKIAFIGCGGVSRLHAAAYARHPQRVEVVAACDPDLQRAEQLAGQFPGCRPFASLATALRDSQWDVGVVCTPTPVRLPVVEELASAGRHVFVEKPLADNLAEATRMVETCEKAGVCLAVHQNFRYHYPFYLARSVIAEGDIGQVTTVLHRDLMFRQDQGWRTSARRHSLAVMGIHWLDGFRWMLDDEPSNLVCALHSSPLIETNGDTEAAIHATFTRGTSVSYVESFSYPSPEVETIVIGEAGSLRMNHENIWQWGVSATARPKERHRTNSYGADKPAATFRAIDEMLQSITDNTVPSNAGRDNLGTVAFLEAAYQSANHSIQVPPTSGAV
jgi:D-apiose dehydrogenase